MTEPQVQTPAQERFVRDVLAWGEPRPRWPPGLVAELRAHLEAAVADVGDALHHAASGRRGTTLSIGRRVLERRVCDGWQLEPEPFRHSVASVRATLARDVIAADWERGGSEPTRALVDRVWHEAATRRPGDPGSRSAWLNRRTGDEAEAIRAEVAALVDDIREVWPVLPAPDLVRDVRRPLEVVLGGGVVTLYGVPDLVLDSHLRDERARALVVDLRTGRPRPERDREALRFHALLVTLARRRPPFRWSSHHVTEGRTESEDLSPEVLFAAADQVVEVVRQLARLGPVDRASQAGADRASQAGADRASPAADPAVSLTAGRWCADCRRRTTCPIAEASRADEHV